MVFRRWNVIGALLVPCATVLALLAPAANADTPPPTGRPDFSGLDASQYPGPIPAARGALLGNAPMAARLSLPGASSARRILYSTEDQRGRRATSTGAVFLPRGTAPRGGWPVLAWAHGTVGLGDTCTPSAQPRSTRDRDYLAHWLNRGYAIVATDYAGLGTPGLMSYLNGAVEASSIVDSVIAAHALGAPIAQRWAIIGQSQGAGAAMNAAQRATRLSRGTALDYRGVVATGTPANIESVLAIVGPTVPPLRLTPALNAYVAYILASLRDVRPDLNVNGLLTPFGRTVVDTAETTCYPELESWLRGSDLRLYFRRPLASLPDAYGALHRLIGTPADGYNRPIFLGQGLADLDVPAPSALSLAAQLAANRQPVELHVYPNRDHSGTVYASVRDSTPFLNRILSPR